MNVKYDSGPLELYFNLSTFWGSDIVHCTELLSQRFKHIYLWKR